MLGREHALHFPCALHIRVAIPTIGSFVALIEPKKFALPKLKTVSSSCGPPSRKVNPILTSPAGLIPVRRAQFELLRALGFGTLQHDSHVPFLSHLYGTRRLLASWGERPALCDAGLFHSVYGTEYFELDRAADRTDVIAVIGAEAERIACLWCTIKRETLDIGHRTVQLRHSNATETLTPSEVGDLATLWAADTVEQINRMEPSERAFARGLRSVIDAASQSAQRAVAALTDWM